MLSIQELLHSSSLPNVRRLLVPDPGYIICDCDLSGADAQVVAWDSDAKRLKELFKSGVKIHDANARDMWGSQYVNADHRRKEKMYKEIKAFTHASNYGAHPKTIAHILGWTIHEAEIFQRRWFQLNPEIKRWHQRIMRDLEETSGVENAFGFRITFMERVDSIFPEALAWIPQSTIAILCAEAATRIEELIEPLQVLIQVHDSIVFQIPRNQMELLTKCKKILHLPVPYSDPLTIPWELSTSLTSWGDCKKIPWPREV